MRASVCRFVSLAIAASALALGGCQGNLGSGPGLNIPQAQPYGQPVGPAGATSTQSRQRSLDGAVFLTADMGALPLPSLDGFGITLQLGSPPPSPSPSPTPTATAASPSPARGKPRRRTKTRAFATTAASTLPTASPTPAPASSTSASPVAADASGSPGPALATGGSVAPALSASGSPASTASASAVKPSSSSSPNVAKTVTKLVVYPEAAPVAPTPQASGNVQSYPIRKALVRGVLKPVADIPLYGLAAVKFTIPNAEDTAARGYTVAVFTAGRRNHDALVTSDAKATATAHIVASNALDALVLKRNSTYVFVLYADELPQAPSSVPSGYPAPGVNPFVTPIPGTTNQGQPNVGSGVSNGPGGYAAPTAPATPTGTYPH